MSVPTATRKSHKAAFALAACLVVLWGFGHRLYDGLMPLFAEVFGLSGLKLGLTLSVYNVVYVFAALPAALYARAFGYKAAILLGLGFLAVGAFTLYPASKAPGFAFFLLAVTAMATGWLILEIAANPLFAAFGPPGRAVFRLNLAQCLYPVGALIGIATGQWILSTDRAQPQAGEAYAIAHPYIVVGALVVLIAFLIEESEFPEAAKERLPGFGGVRREIRLLLAHPVIRFAMVAQFGSVVGMGMLWATADGALRTGFAGLAGAKTADIFFLCTAVFGAGRLIGTALMRAVAPATVLLAHSVLGCAAALAGILGGDLATALAVLGLSLALSISWPTILGLALQGFKHEMKIITAFLALAGAAGGIAYHVLGTAFGGAPHSAMFATAGLCSAVIAAFAYSRMQRGTAG